MGLIEILDKILRGRSVARALYEEGEMERLRRYVKNMEAETDLEAIARRTEVIRGYTKTVITREKFLGRLRNKERQIRRRLSILSGTAAFTLGATIPILEVISGITLTENMLITFGGGYTILYRVFGLLQTIMITWIFHGPERRAMTRNIAIYTLATILATGFAGPLPAGPT